MAISRSAKRKREEPVKQYKSHERINNSDVESEPEEPNVKNVKVTEPASPKVPDDSSESEDEDSADELPAQDKPSDAEGRGEPANTEGTASITLGAGDRNKQTEGKATLNGRGGHKVQVYGGDEDESEEGHSDESDGKDQNKAAEEQEDEDDSDEDSDEDLPDAPTINSTSERKNGNAPGLKPAQPRPAPPFEPPSGFLDVPDAVQSAAARAFQSLSFEGKQIWHITAPAKVSMSKLKEVSLEQVRKGEAVFTSKGINWCLASDSASELRPRSFVVPSKDGYSFGTSAVLRAS